MLALLLLNMQCDRIDLFDKMHSFRSGDRCARMLMTWGLRISVPCETFSVSLAILGYWSVFIEMCRVGLVFSVLGNWCLISLFLSVILDRGSWSPTCLVLLMAEVCYE